MTTELIPGDPGPEEPDGQDSTSEDLVVDDFARIGPYRVVQQLGEGGMGVVHLALDQRGRAVAVKVLRPHVAHDEDARARLAREVATLARVRSPRVAPVFDADLDGDQPYIVTRYVPGPSLDAHVKEHGTLSAEEPLRLGRGLAEALRSLHEIGVVHRDLKPGNVLLVDGDPVLIDFGIAHDADASRMTMTGLVMGTPGYLSPEIIEGAEVDAATDWWGWAATLVFAASGHPPFGRGGMEAVLSRVTRGDVDLTGVDPRLAPLLYAALTPDTARRPHADEVLEALETYAKGHPVTEALPQRARAMPGSEPTSVVPAAPQTSVLPAVAPAPAPRPEPAPSVAPRPTPQPPAHQPYSPQAYASQQLAPQPAPQQLDPSPQAWPGTTPSSREGDPRIGLPRRTGVLLGLLAAVVGGAAVAPLLTAVVVLVGSALARLVDRSMTSTVMRRYQHGRRRSDGAVAAAKSPLHLVVAVVGALAAMLLPLAVGASTLLLVSVAFALLAVDVGPDHPAGLALAGLMTALVVWWGPGSASLRRGTRSIARSLTGSPAARTGITLALWALGVVLLGLALSAGFPSTWWPLVESPLPDTTWLPAR